jgi:predicted 3-demethylubiquinone-9 3-methyltransferase (glyoxalase superfamily)
MQKIKTFLWFDGEAEQAARFYCSVFPGSKVTGISRYAADTPSGKKGSVMTVSFRLAGQEFIALNGGPAYHFTPAISLTVDCRTQAELDRIWRKLTSGGGKPVQCGWLVDRYGLSWQVVPEALGQLLRPSDPARAGKVMEALLGMVKLDIAALKRAAGPAPRGRAGRAVRRGRVRAAASVQTGGAFDQPAV